MSFVCNVLEGTAIKHNETVSLKRSDIWSESSEFISSMKVFLSLNTFPESNHRWIKVSADGRSKSKPLGQEFEAKLARFDFWGRFATKISETKKVGRVFCRMLFWLRHGTPQSRHFHVLLISVRSSTGNLMDNIHVYKLKSTEKWVSQFDVGDLDWPAKTLNNTFRINWNTKCEPGLVAQHLQRSSQMLLWIMRAGSCRLVPKVFTEEWSYSSRLMPSSVELDVQHFYTRVLFVWRHFV